MHWFPLTVIAVYSLNVAATYYNIWAHKKIENNPGVIIFPLPLSFVILLLMIPLLPVMAAIATHFSYGNYLYKGHIKFLNKVPVRLSYRDMDRIFVKHSRRKEEWAYYGRDKEDCYRSAGKNLFHGGYAPPKWWQFWRPRWPKPVIKYYLRFVQQEDTDKFIL